MPLLCGSGFDPALIPIRCDRTQGVAPKNAVTSLADELRELVGKAVFRRISAYLDDRAKLAIPDTIRLPHPAVRNKVAT